ncbi:hypothetical protein [Streptomyces megasporus]|uniref:hypothetical protein n=1 Tax=Streptomyces megasporus TaxID=44060 RepID=UPI0012FEAD67|nr:hypothetical protein [Streptomyces megasporus]
MPPGNELTHQGDPLPFDGAGAVGDKNAMVTARCDAPDAPYVIVDVIVHEKVNDDVTQRRADIAEFIKTFTPKVKKEVGCTVGFLEEARHQATNDKGGDLTDASGKNRAYHLAGRAVTPFGGGKIGDPLQRGVDVIATAWLQEETNRINSEATAEHQMTYDSRNGQLRSLADEWYRVNRDWAEDPGHEDYSKNQGVYSEIAASANDGNKQAEGLAGDQ